MSDKKGVPRQGRTNETRLQAYIDPDVLAAAKRVVYWTPGLTLRAFVEDALREAVTQCQHRITSIEEACKLDG